MSDRQKWGRRYSDNQPYPKSMDRSSLPTDLSQISQEPFLDDSSFYELIGKIQTYRNIKDFELFMRNFRHRVAKAKWLYRGISESEYFKMLDTGKTVGTRYTIDDDSARSWARGDDMLVRIERPTIAIPREYDIHSYNYLDELEVIVPTGTPYVGDFIEGIVDE